MSKEHRSRPERAPNSQSWNNLSNKIDKYDGLKNKINTLKSMLI